MCKGRNELHYVYGRREGETVWTMLYLGASFNAADRVALYAEWSLNYVEFLRDYIR